MSLSILNTRDVVNHLLKGILVISGIVLNHLLLSKYINNQHKSVPNSF